MSTNYLFHKLEAWVKTTNSTGTYTVASYYLGGATNKGGILFIVNGKCQFDGRNGTSTYYSSGAGSTNVADGNWHHVVGTCNNGVWSIYVDGQLENSYTGATGSFSGLSQKVYIGRNEYGSYLKGCAKEVSLWDYDKTATEIYNDYINYQGYTGSETGNKGYWKSDEGTGSTLDDLTSGNHDMTLYNTPTWTTDDYVTFNYCDIQQYQDYMPFGMMQTGRSGGADGYRYGYQGSEADDEVKGDGNSYTTFFRELDPRIGRWLSIDPKVAEIPWQSPYCSMDNNPVALNDPMGDKAKVGKKKEKKEHEISTKTESVVPSGGNYSTEDLLNMPKETTYYLGDEKITKDQYDTYAAENEDIRAYNAKHEKRNSRINAKIALFEGMGFTFTYDPDKGVLKDAVLEDPNVPLEPNGAADILFKTINNSETYKLRTNFIPWQQVSQRNEDSNAPIIAPNAFAFLGKNAGAVSHNAATHANKPQLQKMIAADASEFLGVEDHVQATFRLFTGRSVAGKDPVINFNQYGVQLMLYSENRNGKFDVLNGQGKFTLAF